MIGERKIIAGISERKIIAGIGGAALLGSVVYGLWRRVRSMEEKFSSAVHDVSQITSVDIKESIIEEAVNRTVEREVDAAACRIVRDVRAKMDSEIREHVASAVKNDYLNIQGKVRDALAKEAAKIDAEDLKKQVVKQATEQASKKFNDALDGVLESFNSQLSTVTKIYQSIGSTVTGASNSGNKDVFLKIGGN